MIYNDPERGHYRSNLVVAYLNPHTFKIQYLLVTW